MFLQLRLGEGDVRGKHVHQLALGIWLGLHNLGLGSGLRVRVERKGDELGLKFISSVVTLTLTVTLTSDPNPSPRPAFLKHLVDIDSGA